MHLRLLCALLAGLCWTGCGGDDAAAFSAKDNPIRPTALAELTEGIRIQITNELPETVARPGHPNTVFHLDAFLCARREGIDAARAAREGRAEQSYERRCQPLQGTVHSGSTEMFQVSAQDSAALAAVDEGRVRLEFVSSAQCSSMSYACGGEPLQLPGQGPLQLDVRVTGSSCLAYDCSIQVD